MRDLRNGETATYDGSMTDLSGTKARILGHHPATNGDGTTRYIIAILNGRGDPVQTLSNVRRTSLRHQSDPVE